MLPDLALTTRPGDESRPLEDPFLGGTRVYVAMGANTTKLACITPNITHAIGREPRDKAVIGIAMNTTTTFPAQPTMMVSNVLKALVMRSYSER